MEQRRPLASGGILRGTPNRKRIWYRTAVTIESPLTEAQLLDFLDAGLPLGSQVRAERA